MNMPYIEATKEQKLTQLRELLNDWIAWLYTRRFYAAPVPRNILVRMMEEHAFKTGEPPNAKNSALCSAFNKVLILAHAREPEYLIPFMYVYLKQYRPQKIQALAITMELNTDTIYQRAGVAAIRYLNQAETHVRLSNMNEPDYYDVKVA